MRRNEDRERLDPVNQEDGQIEQDQEAGQLDNLAQPRENDFYEKAKIFISDSLGSASAASIITSLAFLVIVSATGDVSKPMIYIATTFLSLGVAGGVIVKCCIPKANPRGFQVDDAGEDQDEVERAPDPEVEQQFDNISIQSSDEKSQDENTLSLGDSKYGFDSDDEEPKTSTQNASVAKLSSANTQQEI